MDSKKFLTLFALVALALPACTSPTAGGDEGDFLVGAPLAEVSGLTKLDGNDSEKVVIFDETTRMIHQFRLSDMKYEKGLGVRNPQGKHVVLSQEQGNYIIDISDKLLTIYDSNGVAQNNPIILQGNPISAAFRSDVNLLIIYDDLSSVGIVQMDSTGRVTDKWMGGSLFGANQSIVAGDLLANKRLVLSMSDGTIAVVDIAATLAHLPEPEWVFTSFASGVTNKISWLAPVGDNVNQIFVKSSDELAIIDLNTQTKVTTFDTTAYLLEKLSKSGDGHIAARGSNRLEINMFYPKAGAILNRVLHHQDKQLASSFLSISKNFWSFVELANPVEYARLSLYNDIDYTKYGRTLKQIRLSDMLALQKRSVPDQAQAMQSPSYVFSLFPAELGYATRTDITNGDVVEAKYFNIGHH